MPEIVRTVVHSFGEQSKQETRSDVRTHSVALSNSLADGRKAIKSR